MLESGFQMTTDIASPSLARMDDLLLDGWLASARLGDAGALEHLYEAHRGPIYTLCLRLLGRPEDAEDAMQATFSRVFQAISSFRGDCALKTWIYRIAVNEAMEILRRRRRAPDLLSDETPMADQTPDLLRSLAVRSALARLGTEHRTILILRYWEELSYEEIARVLQSFHCRP